MKLMFISLIKLAKQCLANLLRKSDFRKNHEVVPNIFSTWEDVHWKEPVIEECFDSDRTILTLEFIKKQAIKLKETT